MILHIYNDLRISDIQERFSKCFPCLKIEFYHKLHHQHQSSSEEDQIDSNKLIGEIRHNYQEGKLDLKSWHTVEYMERAFKKKFGLHVQVFRKESGRWVQTVTTDSYTLHEQTELCY